MAWGREAVETRTPDEGGTTAVPIVTKPGAIQFIPGDADHAKIEGMIFACPSGKGCLTVLHFSNVMEGHVGAKFYTWNRSVKYPSIVEEIFVARSGWRGFLKEGRWVGEVEIDDEACHSEDD